MSAYSQVQTQFTDPELLVEALRELGYNPVVSIGKPQPLRGIGGDYRTRDGQGHTRNAADAMTGEIIIPRSQVGGASNEVGFSRGADGKYTAIISAYDSHTNFALSRQQQLAGQYADCKVKREAKRAGLRMTGRKVQNGKVEYLFIKA